MSFFIHEGSYIDEGSLTAEVSVKQVRWACECGQTLRNKLICIDCRRKYRMENNLIETGGGYHKSGYLMHDIGCVV